MKNQATNYFWTSFSDLMTSLFFIMLVLYVLTFIKLKNQQKLLEEQKKATEEQLNKIKEIQTAATALDPNYFTYQETYKRFVLNRSINFKVGSHDIPIQDHDYLIDVGKSIADNTNQLKEKYKDKNIKYLIVIEGMASRDNYDLNYQLSYLRALSLYNFWKDNQIKFDDGEDGICEVQIAGSGTGGIGRDRLSEYKNQQFLIHIVPKIGKIK